MANAAPQLQEAYELIESGDLQSARQLLDGIRSHYDNNPDFWWIYSHAVENEADGLAALDRVRQLAPNYPGLQMLSEQLGIASLQSNSITEDAPSTADVEEYHAEEYHAITQAQQNRSPLPFFIVAGIVVVLLILGFSFIANLLSGGNDDDTPTQVAIVTDVSPEPIIPTADSEAEISTEDTSDSVEPTDVVVEPATDAPEPTPDTTDSSSNDLTEALSVFGVPEDGMSTTTTETFGETYTVTTCSALGPIATQNILGIVDLLGDNLEIIDDSIAGFAFEIADCTSDTVRLVLGIPRDIVDEYWAGTVDQSQIQQSLQRVTN